MINHRRRHYLSKTLGEILMNRNYHAFAMLLAAFILPVGAARADEGYFGIKFGPMLVDVSELDNPINLGLYFGSSRSSVAFEAEITASAVKGGTDLVDLSITTFGAYAVYRTRGVGPFFKVKAGFVNEDVTFKGFGRSESTSDSGSSLGVGIGSRSEDSFFEIEITVIEEDVNFLSLGASF
jgi:hypothetical protein